MARILNNIKKIAKAIWYADSYVVLNAARNLIQVSKGLYDRLDIEYRASTDIITFRINDGSYAFAFVEDADIKQQTETSTLQSMALPNGKKIIGFIPTPITVNRILYDYHLPDVTNVKLTVIPREVYGMKVFVIQPPRLKR